MTNEEILKTTRLSYIEAQIDGILPPEVYEIYVKPNFNSASWRFHNDKHQIVIGENIFHNATNIIDFVGEERYLNSYLYHELAHSVWTEKDIKFINDELFIAGVPFALFNLFEDARIEEKMRLHIRKPFNWARYETLQAPTNALGIFF